MTPLAKRLFVALAVSVALNLLLGGIWLGRSFRRPPSERDGIHAKHEGRRGPMRGVLREHRAELGERRRAIGEAQHAARAAFEREPFDRQGLEAALAKLRAETGESQKRLHQALVDAAAKAPLDQRRELGRAFAEHGRAPGAKRP